MKMECRVATSDDAEFIYRVVETTMRRYVELTWGSFNEDGNRKAVAEKIAGKTYSVVQFGGEDVGALAVERLATHIQLDQLFILPSHQNRGIGASLVRELAREARDAKKPLRLRVLAVNPAQKLYAREGFRVTSTTPERVYMELGA
jgi:GNAT superfamily N-acetyltransferase